MNPNLPPRGGILHVYAHPDDESFGNPATIAFYAGRGHPMHLVTLTRGEAGETNGVCAPEELGPVREAELRAACEILGIPRPEIWRYPDGGLGEIDSEEAISRLIALYEKTAPEVIVTYGEDGVTGHPDHIAVSRWATEAFLRLREKGAAAPSRLYWRTMPEKRRKLLNRNDITYRTDYTTIVDAREFLSIRARAEACHRSQRPHTEYARPDAIEMGAVDYYLRIFPDWRKGSLFEDGLFGEGHYPDDSTLP